MRTRLVLLFALLIAAGCSDSTVGTNNSPPEATIELPSVGTEVLEGSEVEFAGVVEDRGTRLEDLEVSWSSSIDGILLDGLADTEGQTGFTSSELSIGEHTITLQVRDGMGATGQATVDLVVRADAAPEITITSPLSEGVYYSNFPVALQATVNDAEDLPADLRVSWQVDGGDVLVEEAIPDSTGATTNNVDLEAGTYSLIATVTDSAANTKTDTVTFIVGPPNTAPTCAITAPATESSFPIGQLVTFEGSVGDVDVPADWLSVSFESNVDGPMGTASPSSEGLVLLPVSSLTAATHAITMNVEDEVGATCTTIVVVTISNPPTAEILTPLATDTYSDNEAIEFTGLVQDSEDADSNLLAEWSSDLGGPLGVSTPDSSGSIALNETLSAGTHLVTLTATDSVGLTGTDTVTLNINACPTSPSVSILPVAPSTLDDLTVSIDNASTDPDTGPSSISYAYEWTLNGNPMPAYSGLTTVPAAATAALETWAVEVTPTDGLCSSTPGTAAIAIGNSIPSITSASISPAVGLNTDTYTVTPTGWTDLDGDPEGYQYQWYVDGSPVAAATAATWTPIISNPAGYPAGSSIWCEVTPWDGQSTGLPVNSSLAAINTPPGVAGVLISPSTAYEDTVLTASYGLTNDVDGQTVTLAWQWSLNGNLIVGATSTSLDGASFDAGDSVTVTATPNDGLEDGAPATSTAVIISNTAPSITSVSITPAAGTEATTFTCTPSGWTDIDGDTEAYDFAWTVNTVPSVTTASIDGASFDKDDVLACTATPNDGTDSGTPITSAAVTVGNTAPSITSVAITPAAGTEATTFTCTPAGWADIDGDTEAYTYAWTINSSPSAVTAASIDGTSFDKDDVLACTATPTDGTDAGTPVTSSSVTVANTPPSITSVAISPTSGGEATTFTCTPAGWTDIDPADATPAYTYAWTVNTLPSVATATIDGASFDAGDSIACTATPTDGTDAGTPVTSSSVTVGNTAPSISSVAITPAAGTEATTFTCTPAGWSDIDGDTPSYQYQWYVGVSASVTTATIDGASFDKGDMISCDATPTDGVATGATLSSGVVTVDNTPPSISSVSISPTSGGEATTFTCTPAGWSDIDPADATPAYTYAWTVNTLPSVATATIDGASFDAGDSIACTATPTDGTDAGTPLTSGSITVGNTAPSITSVSITPSTAYTNTTLTAVPSGWSDIDGDSPSYMYDWFADSSPVGGDTATLEGSFFSKGQSIIVTVTPQDASSSGSPVTSGAVLILNSAPTAPTVAISPSGATDADDLLCSVTTASNDLDSDGISYSYAWLVDGNPTSNTGSTLASSNTAVGETWTCVVTPNDGQANGPVGSDSEGPLGSSCTASDITAQGVNFVGLCGGTFDMGCTTAQQADGNCQADESPVHSVVLAKDFWMSETEVTQDQWQSLTGTAPSYYSGCGSDCPVERVNWYEALELANDLSAAEGLDACYTLSGCSGSIGSGCGTNTSCTSGTYQCTSVAINSASGDVDDCEGYRLPTEAEWEYAARAGTDFLYAGSDVASDVAWFGSTSGTREVATKLPNSWDIYDLSGNVYEWVWDYFESSYYSNGPSIDPTGAATGSYRVVRGGAYNDIEADTRVSARVTDDTPDKRSKNRGIRLARTVPVDADGDGFFMDEDCDDNDSAIYPQAGDTYGDGIDSDCDGLDCEAATYGSAYFALCGPDLHANGDSICAAGGYNFGSIQSAGENAAIEDLLRYSPMYQSFSTAGGGVIWLNYSNTSGAWLWDDGYSGSYTNWAPGKPDETNVCAYMDIDGSGGSWPNGSWDDTACTGGTRAILCTDRDADGDGFDVGQDCDDNDPTLTITCGALAEEICAQPGEDPSAAGWAVNSSGSAGSFGDGTSTSNGGGSGGITDPSWGLWSNLGGNISASWPLAGSLLPGEGVGLEFDNGWVENAGTVLVDFGQGNSTGVQFSFSGGNSNYTVADAASSSRDTGFPFTANGFALTFVQTDSGGYRLFVNGQMVIAGTLSNGLTSVDTVTVTSSSAGAGSTNWDLFFNCISTYLLDADGDGYFSSEDCDDNDPTIWAIDGSSAACPSTSCLAIRDDGYSTGDGTYWIDPDGSGPFEAYCDMTTDDGGWTLVLRGAGNSACRTTMILGNATAQAPLNPSSVPASVEMFSEATIAAIQSPGTSSSIGIRFTRDGQGSKFVPSSCQLGFAPGTNDYADCLTYTTTYSSTPSWQVGGNNGTTTMTCSNPLGTSGNDASQLVAMGLYDCSTCFDAWGFGISANASVWVR